MEGSWGGSGAAAGPESTCALLFSPGATDAEAGDWLGDWLSPREGLGEVSLVGNSLCGLAWSQLP